MSRSNVLHDRERHPRDGTLARDRPIFPRRFPKAKESVFVLIVHLYKMSSTESGSLTQKDGAIFSLTARDLQNHSVLQ